MKKSLLKKIAMVATCTFVFVSFVGCGSSKGNEEKSDIVGTKSEDNPIVTMEIEGMGNIVLELYPDVAPNTVNNFISLVKDGFYDGLTFHRVIDGFMIQGGDPNGNGTGGPGYSIKGEFSGNDFQNDLSHTVGVISMARSLDPDSAGSQFFIMSSDTTSLDGQYAAFGKVLEGLDVVEKISKTSVDSNDKPKEDVVIKKVTIDTKGKEYSEPEKIEE